MRALCFGKYPQEEAEKQSGAKSSELLGFHQLSMSHSPEVHSWLFKLKHLMEGKYGSLWVEMLAKLEKLAEDHNKNKPMFSNPWGLVAEIPVHELSEQFQDCCLLYNATNAGALVYNQNFDCDTVRFLYPLQALYCHEHLRQHEAVEWLTPPAPVGLATESVCIELQQVRIELLDRSSLVKNI